MASNQTKELWRSRIERLLATDMGVTAWCNANKVSDSSMFKWIGFFADTEPELFGGYEIAHAGDGHRNWFEHVRNAMAERTALAVRGPAPAFAVVGSLDLELPEPGSRPAAGAPIVVSANGATVEVPAGCAEADVACVLRAVMSL